MNVKCMLRSGNERIRTQIQPSKPKREITNISLCILTICNISYFPFCFLGLIWVLIASFPDFCIRFTFIINSQKTKRTYCQSSDQLFPKRWPLSNRNRTKNDINTHKVKRDRNSDTKSRQQRSTTELSSWNGQ